MATKRTINEATLEARIDAVLKNIFPTFREVNVIHQKYFSINFGKHNVLVDLKEPSTGSTKAILDVLLKIDDTNIILLELKREGLQLDENDVNQGLSYARLTHPMPPIVLISNGIDNWFFNSYTKEKIDKTSVDMEYIQTLVDNSFKLAVNDFKDAVKILLNNDYSLFSKIINQISELKFQRLIGTINEYNKPICNEFKIERKIIKKIDSFLFDSQPLIGIVGSAFSGKTNLLYQFFEKYKDENCFLLYIDCNDHNYSIIQQLANHFTSNTKILITKDKIREWLINSFTDLTESKFFLLVDNFNDYIPEEIKNEIIELIDIFKGVNHYTIYTIDEYNFKKIAFVENRQYMTIIGEHSKIINLDELDDDEYEVSKNVLFDKFRIAIEHGGHYTPEYREPRVLRHLANIYKDNDVVENQFIKIVAVPDYEHLKAFAGSGVYSKNVRELYKKVTICFISEQPLRKKDSDLQIIASGSGAILMETFKKKFPEDLEELIKSSVVILKDLQNGKTVIYPKIPELIAYYSIPFISKLVMDESKKGKNYQEICNFFIDIMMPFPYCDISATGVLMEIAYTENEVELFSELVQELLKIPPHFEQINKGTKTLMYLEDIGHIQLNFEDTIDEGGFVSDFFPYAVLSQLAGYPLGLVDNDRYSKYDFHLYLLNTVGSNKNFIRRADVRSLKNMKSIESFEWEEIGYIISGNEGIIEPIVQSIQKCFLEIPEEIEKLYDKAFEENNFPLIWRIYLALRTMLGYSDDKLANQAKSFVKRFNKYFNDFIVVFLTKDVDEPTEKQRIREILSKMKK